MTQSPPSRSRDQSRTGQPRGKRRWGRRVLITLLVLVCLGGVSWWAFKGPITKAIVLNKLEEALGSPVDASAVDLLADGSLELHDVVIRSPGLSGDAGEVLRAERVLVKLELGSEGPTPSRVQIDRPLIRLSIDRESGAINFAGIGGSDPDPARGPLLLPVIEITEGTLEFGEHGVDGYAVLKAVPLVGEVLPLAEADGYSIEVRTPAGASEAPSVPMRIVGSLRESGVSLRLDRVRLQEWVPGAVPTAYRDIIESLAIQGDVSSVTFSTAMDGSDLQTQVSLQGVRMKLPVGDWLDTEGEPIDAAVRTGTLRLKDRGLQIELDALAAGVPLAVDVRYQGLSTDSPFEATVEVRAYAMPKDPPWLEYMPRGVQWRIESFNYPTGVVDATIRAARADVGGATEVEGEARFRDAVAAFHAFPYEVRSLSGTVRFNSEELLLEGIRGVSEQGARVTAGGRIAPPGDGAAVSLDIDVQDAPLDEAMTDAMGPQRRRMVDGLFHKPSYDQLAAMGLLGGEGTDLPKFELGGSSDVKIRIRRKYGDKTSWERDIRVTLDRAGVVTEAFPLPVIAEGVVIHLDGKTAQIDDGRFVPMTGGGVVALSAEVDLTEGDQTSMWLSLTASDIPVDERLAFAVSNAGAVQRGAEMMTRAVTGLRLEGRVDCEATITTGRRSTVPGDNAEYDVAVELNGLTASPQGSDGSLRLVGVDGTIVANSQRAGVNIEGRVEHEGRPAGETSLAVEVNRRLSEGDLAEFTGRVVAQDLDLIAPVEELIAVFADKAADAMRDLRAQFRPEGRAWLTVLLDGRGEGVQSAVIDVSRTQRATIDSPLGRAWVTQNAGLMRFVPTIGDPDAGIGVATLEASAGEIGSGTSAAAVYTAGGTWEIDRESGPSLGRGDVDLRLDSARTEHPLARVILQRALPTELHDDLSRLDPSGTVAGDLHLHWVPTSRIQVSGEIRPSTIEVSRGDRRIPLRHRSGTLALQPSERPTGGSFRSLELTLGEGDAPASIRVDGGWINDEKIGGELEMKLALEAPQGLQPDVLAMLPEPVSTALNSASITSSEPLTVDLTTLRVGWKPSAAATYTLDGRARVRQASAQVGTKITELDGVVDFTSRSRKDAGPGVRFEVDVHAESMRVAGIRATEGRVLLNDGADYEIVAVPQIRALVHGGRLVGEASLRYPQAEQPDAAEGLPFAADLRLASVAFAEVLADLRVETDQLAMLENDANLRDRSRGLMDARVGLTGTVGDQSRTVGTGSVVIGGGRVLELPLVLRLIQVSNLEAPSDDPVDMAEATFVVKGDRVEFEKLSVYTPSVEIAGHGTMRWTDQDLDLRFASRRVRRIPIVSEALERFRDEIVQTRVSGVLADPQVSLSQFSGTRALFARLLGEGQDDAALRLDRARRLAEQRERIRRVDDQASRFLATPNERDEDDEEGDT